jgi:hypothetical protein
MVDTESGLVERFSDRDKSLGRTAFVWVEREKRL